MPVAICQLVMLFPSTVLRSEEGPTTARPTTVLPVGTPAPSFSGIDDQGGLWKSADHVGKKILVVWFYRADFLRSCTQQALGFEQDLKSLRDRGVELIGVSGDAVETHRTFKERHRLGFRLLSDPEGR
ncbi:MAG: peroxiredoxin, partial [Planctomycetaceae bacterium]